MTISSVTKSFFSNHSVRLIWSGLSILEKSLLIFFLKLLEGFFKGCTISTALKLHTNEWGAVIVKDDEIISTGYNGSPRGRKNCCDIGECYRIKNNIPRGTHYESCRSIHAEANAIIYNPVESVTLAVYGHIVIFNPLLNVLRPITVSISVVEVEPFRIGKDHLA